MAIKVIKDDKTGKYSTTYTGADSVMNAASQAAGAAASFVGGAVGAVKRAGGAVLSRIDNANAQDNQSKMKGVVDKVGLKNAQRVFGSAAVYNAMGGLMK